MTASLETRVPEGFPAPDTVDRVYRELDLARAIGAYRVFYPSVSGYAIFKGNEPVGIVDNEVFGILDTSPTQVGYTLNSDTPYGGIPLDLHAGPMVVDLPAGPLMCAVVDVHQRWVADMGLPGPDAGKGGRHVVLPPGWEGEEPQADQVCRAQAYRVLVGARSIPVGGDVEEAKQRLRRITVRPLDPAADLPEARWIEYSDKPQDTSPHRWERSLDYWRALKDVVDTSRWSSRWPLPTATWPASGSRPANRSSRTSG